MTHATCQQASTWSTLRGAKQRSSLAASICVGVMGFAGNAHAFEAFYPITKPETTASFQGGMVIGSRLLTYSDVTFNSLGFIDVVNNPQLTNHNDYLNADTLLGSYQVGIWLESTQTLLASTWVTPNTPRLTESGNFYSSVFRYAPIAPTTIRAGQAFIVAALLPANPQDAWLSDILNANGPDIVGLASGRYMTGNTLSFPSQAWGATVAVADASTAIVAAPVPEPATAACIAFGLGGLALYRRRFSTKATA